MNAPFVIKGFDGYVGAYGCGTWRDKHVPLADAYRFVSMAHARHVLWLFGGVREIVSLADARAEAA